MSRPLDVRSAPVACARCGGSLATSTMSYFNTDTICLDCRDDEERAPGFAAAKAAELAAVQSGNTRFAGVGLGPDDVAFLEARRLARIAAGTVRGWRWHVVEKRTRATVVTLDDASAWNPPEGRKLSEFYFVRLKEEQPTR